MSKERHWKWYKKDLPDNTGNPRVFGTFLCGGGSSFGAKLSGFDHIGGVEIDPKLAEVYRINHHPKHLYAMDLREFVKNEVYKELGSVDILEGSPPCTTFSTAGKREKSLGVKKKFSEGQSVQVLDDLFFTWLELLGKMQPRIGIAENVPGILKGTMKGYVAAINKAAISIGYKMQVFVLNSKFIGVPQDRTRVFFIFNNFDTEITIHSGNIEPIPFGIVRTKDGISPNKYWAVISKQASPAHRSIGKARKDGRTCGWSTPILHDNYVASTISSIDTYRSSDGLCVSNQDLINISSFPQDFDNNKYPLQFICGMSVPPLMSAWVFDAIREQWFDESQFNKKKKRSRAA